MTAFVRSMFVWFVCHWGKDILWPELSKLDYMRENRRVGLERG